MIIRIFAASVPTKPLNDAQMRGAFFVYIRSLSKYANGKITALHETLYDRGRLDGSVEKSWACHFRLSQSGTVFGEHRVLSPFCLYVPILESSKGNSSV